MDTVNGQFLTNGESGWTCRLPAKPRGLGGPMGCYCAGLCGNGGAGADSGTMHLGFSQEQVDKDYGGGKAGNKTGWLCGNYRGTFK